MKYRRGLVRRATSKEKIADHDFESKEMALQGSRRFAKERETERKTAGETVQ